MVFEDFKYVVWDCDGVILNSNSIKSNAFGLVGSHYGRPAQEWLVKHHKENGGVSRYKKFAAFVDYLEQQGVTVDVDLLLEDYSRILAQGLPHVEVAKSLGALRASSSAVWTVASGSDQVELRSLLAQLGLDKYFDGGIYGSPETKFEIVRRLARQFGSLSDSVMLGDSKYDHQVAAEHGMYFAFVSGWTEFYCWQRYFEGKPVVIVPSVEALQGHVFETVSC